MRSLGRRLIRKGGEGVLIVECAAILIVSSGALRFCHFQTLRRALMLWARTGRPLFGRLDASTIVSRTERVASRLRGLLTCLSVALTAEALMKQHGHDSILCLGAKRSAGSFSAHAWLERNDSVVIGGPRELTLEYTRFPEIPN